MSTDQVLNLYSGRFADVQMFWNLFIVVAVGLVTFLASLLGQTDSAPTPALRHPSPESRIFKNNFPHPFNHLPLQQRRRPHHRLVY